MYRVRHRVWQQWFSLTCILITFYLSAEQVYSKDCPDQYFLSLKIKSASKCEAQHNITIGSGIVSPSLNAIFAENPAGLLYNQSLKVHFSAAKLSDSIFDPWRVNATIVTGDGEKGAGIGAFNYQFADAYGTGGGTNTILAYGAALEISALNLGIGVSGFTALDLLTSIVGQSDENPFNPTVGIIFNPKGVVRVAATAYDVLDEYRTIGAGIASFVGSSFSAALDFTRSTSGTYDSFGNYVLDEVWLAKFGLGYASDSFQLSMTYGHQLSTGTPVPTIVESWNRSGLSLGLAFALSENLKFNGYLNRLELYYLGLTVGF